MIPKTGCNQEWDDLNRQIEQVIEQFDVHLQEVKKDLK